MLRLITHKDIEKIRIWRNNNKDAFFYNKVISMKEQAKWIKDYLTREDDRMYMVEYLGKDIGCLGFRPFGEHIELYNVILGNKKYKRQGLMSKALQILLKIIGSKVVIRIIKDNKEAVSFYTKNGVGHDFSIWLESRAGRT